jgi:hypothetical protein
LIRPNKLIGLSFKPNLNSSNPNPIINLALCPKNSI